MATLVVPWAPGDAHREAAWSQLKQRHLDAGRAVAEGNCAGPWCKAAAVADALTRTDDDLLVIHDADVWCDGLNEAIDAVRDGAPWAIPHWRVFRLAQGQNEPTPEPRLLDRKPYPGWEGGGIVVIPRATYEATPLDPRFIGWGQEDASWALALSALHGRPWRGGADLWHWWHPPQPKLTDIVGSRESKALWARYRDASDNRRVMQEIIEEAKSWQSTSASTVPA